MKSVPQLPDSAPFNAAQRLWLNGYLAALFNDVISSLPVQDVKPKARVLIMFASQSGNSEELAEAFGEKLISAGFDAPVISTEDYEEIDLTKEKTLLVVSSTWGDGDPPDNAVDFWKFLSSDDHPRLEGLSYSVLGLGDSNYLDFCGMGKAFDARFEALGAKRIAPRGDCDVDFEDAAAAWFETVLSELGTEVAEDEKSSGAEKTAYSKKNPFPAKLITNTKLNAEESDRDTRHFELSLAGSGMTYEVGDVLGVYPRNDEELVDELITLMGFDPEELIDGQTLRDALICTYDVRTINKGFLESWMEFSESPALRELLETDPEESPMEPYLFGREVIDVAIEHPASFPNASAFVGLLRKLGARLYSISSSPKAHKDEVHLTVAKVEYEAHGRSRKGVCSTYLSDRVNGDGTVPVYLQTAKHFKLPEDLSVPVIMVGPGTGIAPFRAFLEERAATNSPGKNWLFFGNPFESTDFFYKEELEGMLESGVLTTLSSAWSRDQETKIYVQDRMRENGAELWKWLEEGAHFYVCGDAKRMAKDVDTALHDIIAEYGGISGEDYISAMKKSKRYQRDVY